MVSSCIRIRGSVFAIISMLISPLSICGQARELEVKLVKDDLQHKVDVIIGGKLFTSYCYSSDYEKPFLYPVYAANGSLITRGFPIEPRKGERVDHPHHIGLWFNHGSVNGLDFWNNSSAIPAEKKDEYGHIVVRKLLKVESGKKGTLVIQAEWADNKGNVLLAENTTYIFSAIGALRIVDHLCTLTAVNGPVTFSDSKEGMFAIRLDRALEMPSEEPLIFTDEKGNPTTVGVIDNTGVSGMYSSNTGLKGDAVWGTRNDWVLLTGIKDSTQITIGMFDHPKNPGYPAYAHARGYGLFSINNFGQNSYDPKMGVFRYTLEKGKSVRLVHRFVVQSGIELSEEKASILFRDFSEGY